MSLSPLRQYGLGGVALLLGFLLCAACAPEWRVNPQYGYGWVIPFIIVYLIFSRLNSISLGSNPPFIRGGTIGIVGLLMMLSLLIEWARLQHPPMRMIMGLQGGIWFLFIVLGWRDYPSEFRRSLMIPALLLLTAIPWPTRIEEPLTRFLMSGVTGVAIELLHLAGFLAHREGELIIFPNAIVGVSEACSGIRSLQASLVFSLLLGEWRRGGFKQRAELLLLGASLSVFGNLLRTLALCGIAATSGMESMEKWHDTSGNLLLFILMGTLVAWSYGRIPHPPDREEKSEGLEGRFGKEVGQCLCAMGHRPSLGMTIVLIAALIFLLITNMFYFLYQKQADQGAPPLVQWIYSEGDQARSIPSEVWRNLRASSGEWIELQVKGFEFGKAEFYHFYWQPIRDSQGVRLHRPDWCMKGIGWKQIGEPMGGEIEIQGGKLQGYWLQYRKPKGEALQFWTLLRNQNSVPIDFHSSGAIENFGFKSFLFPREERSAWEMISLVVSSPWIAPEKNQVEQIAKERVFRHPK